MFINEWRKEPWMFQFYSPFEKSNVLENKSYLYSIKLMKTAIFLKGWSFYWCIVFIWYTFQNKIYISISLLSNAQLGKTSKEIIWIHSYFRKKKINIDDYFVAILDAIRVILSSSFIEVFEIVFWLNFLMAAFEFWQSQFDIFKCLTEYLVVY